VKKARSFLDRRELEISSRESSAEIRLKGQGMPKNYFMQREQNFSRNQRWA
jgi:hypothetical protein